MGIGNIVKQQVTISPSHLQGRVPRYPLQGELPGAMHGDISSDLSAAKVEQPNGRRMGDSIPGTIVGKEAHQIISHVAHVNGHAISSVLYNCIKAFIRKTRAH